MTWFDFVVFQKRDITKYCTSEMQQLHVMLLKRDIN